MAGSPPHSTFSLIGPLLSDHYIEVEKGEVLAYTEEVCSNVETIGVQKVEVAEKGGPKNGKREIPEHLCPLRH
jgi:hypothetical protein